MTPDARQPGFYPRIQLSKYGLKPKGDYDIFDLSVTAAALMSKYGLKPKGDYDFQVMRHAPRNYLPSKYGLKPKGDYDPKMAMLLWPGPLQCPNTD